MSSHKNCLAAETVLMRGHLMLLLRNMKKCLTYPQNCTLPGAQVILMLISLNYFLDSESSHVEGLD